MATGFVSAFVVGAVVLSAADPAAAQPENPGPLAFLVWDAGSVDAAGAGLPTRVYYPSDGGGPYPVVGVIHGASRNGSYMRVLAETLASRGLVAVVPTIPCNFLGCNHDENAAQLSALLDWAVTQSGTAGSPLEGLVDGERRGLIGHSWGALASHLAASRDDRIDAVVLLDPNDDVGVGLAGTGSVRAPTLQLLAQAASVCNNQWDEAAVGAALPSPRLQVTIAGSAHCDPEDPSDSLCPLACGFGDRSTTPFFRRYAVAWIACVLAGDPEMGRWLGGSSFAEDMAAGRLRDPAFAGLETLPCPLPAGPDADADGDGGEEVDGGGGADADGGTDAEPDPGVDGTADVVPDAPADGGPGGGDGCGCRTAGGERPRAGGFASWVLAVGCGLVSCKGGRARARARSRGASTITVSDGGLDRPGDHDSVPHGCVERGTHAASS